MNAIGIKQASKFFITIALCLFCINTSAFDLEEAYSKRDKPTAVIGQAYFATLITYNNLESTKKLIQLSEKLTLLYESQYESGLININQLNEAKSIYNKLKQEEAILKNKLTQEAQHLQKVISTSYSVTMIVGLNRTNSLQKLHASLGNNSAEINSAYQKVTEAKQALTTAEENYQHYKTQYYKGKYSTIDLLKAEQQIIEKQNQYTTARYQYLITLIEFTYKTGSLTEALIKKIDKSLSSTINLPTKSSQ